MARLSKEEAKKRAVLILADWKTGYYSQNQLAKNYDVSPATINKICKNIEQSNQDLVNTQTAIHKELSNKSECEVNALHKAVDERTE